MNRFRKPTSPQSVTRSDLLGWLRGREYDADLVQSWRNPAGWTLLTPTSWTRDPTGTTEGFVPPGDDGRLTIFPTFVAKEPTPPTEERTADALRDLARAVGITSRVTPRTMANGPDHLLAAFLARDDTLYILGVAHVISPGIVVTIAWTSPTFATGAWRMGAAAAGSVHKSEG
jgi:hypothetical protein